MTFIFSYLCVFRRLSRLMGARGFLSATLAASCLAAPIQRSSESSGKPALAGKQTHSRSEIISYGWEISHVEVRLTRESSGDLWTVTVRDSLDVHEQSTKRDGKVWDVLASRCSQSECLLIIGQSLSDFRAEKPEAHFKSLDIEMHVVKDLWGGILTGLGQRLATLEGKKSAGIFEVPTELGKEVQRVISNSPVTTAIKDLLKQHGMISESVLWSQTIMFKESLSGKKWSEIATLPGLGILAPGTITFEFQTTK